MLKIVLCEMLKLGPTLQLKMLCFLSIKFSVYKNVEVGYGERTALPLDSP